MLINELIKRKNVLNSIISGIGEYKAPKGFLRCSKNSDNKYDYYYCTNDNPRGSYIHRNNTDTARELAQAKYDKQVKAAAIKELSQIEKMIKIESSQKIARLYEKTCDGRKELIHPYEISSEHFARLWQNAEYKKRGFAEDAPEIYTKKGERVRSKSEKIIADLLYEMGIPYHYEFPLMLEGVGVIYPDFKTLIVKDREILYIEHFGMMDNPEYVSKALLKIESYEKNGIYVGKNLLLTHETRERPINTRVLRKKLEAVFF